MSAPPLPAVLLAGVVVGVVVGVVETGEVPAGGVVVVLWLLVDEDTTKKNIQ